MDSKKNRDNNTNRPQGQEWENPDFAWDEMKEGIFGKILEEEPDFFAEKPRRRFALWFWLGAAVLLLGGGFGLWQFAGSEGEAAPNAPANAPAEDQTSDDLPVAHLPVPATAKNLSANAKNAESQSFEPGTASAQIPSEKRTGEEPRQKADFSKNNNETASSKTALDISTTIEQLTTEQLAAEQLATGPWPSITDTPDRLPVPLRPFDTGRTGIPSVFAKAKNEESDSENESERETDTPPSQGQWKVAATGGTLLSFSKYAGSGAAADLRNDHTSPYFGYQFGVQAAAPLSERSHLLFGLNRQVVYQNIDIRTERQVEVLEENALLHVTHYVVGGRVAEVRGDTLLTGTERNRLVNYNEFRSWQAQAGYGRELGNEKWALSPFVALSVGLLTHQEGLTVAEDKSIFAFDTDNPIMQRLQLGTRAGFSLERKLAREFSLVFQYQFDQQWNNASAEAGLTLRPASHFISAGVAKRW